MSPEVLCVWPGIVQCLHPKSISDHNPISLSIMDPCWGPRPFKWFDYLLEDKGLVDKIESECGKAAGSSIFGLLKSCKKKKEFRKDVMIQMFSLISWEREGNCGRQSAKKNTNGFKNHVSIGQWPETNTRYFHLIASARKNSNFIGSIKVGDVVLSNPGDIKKEIDVHFKKIYNTSNTIPIASFDCELSKLRASDAVNLEKPFTEEEIWSALSNIGSSKALGPNGFNMGFLKKF
ncbi:hypothetical protein V6N13_013253 [Hibiscus sabdariffa]